MPESIRVEFEQLGQPTFPDLPVRVTVHGPFSRRGGAAFRAQVGRQEVEAISFNADGTGFIGYLQARPQGGDELVLRRGDVIVPTGARFGTPAAIAHEMSEAFSIVQSVPGALSRTLGVDVPRGVQMLGATGAPLAIATDRSWIQEGAGLTVDLRAFGASSRSKTGRIRLNVRVPNLPSGGRIVWSVPPANRGQYTLGTNPAVLVTSANGPSVDLIGLVPGLSAVDVEVRDASNTRIESWKFPLCIPQFVEVKEDAAAFNAALATYNLDDARDQVLTFAKATCDSVLRHANVRTVWTLAPFRETIPAQFAAGGVAASRLTVATIKGDTPAGGLFGATFPGTGGFGPGVFNEVIELFPGAYNDPLTSGAVESVDEATIAATTAIARQRGTSSPDRNKAMELLGRLIGETLAHEIGHALIGATLGAGGHNAPSLPHSLMNQGSDRSLQDRTGFRTTATPITLASLADTGVSSINVFTGAGRTSVDRHFPVPPVFA